MYCSTKGYYLSLFSSNLQVQFFYFKTPHVIVYLPREMARQVDGNFKTSHVIVYPTLYYSQTGVWLFQNISCYCLSNRNPLVFCKFFISKHLMLLFIHETEWKSNILFEFQNISCYCLSTVDGVTEVKIPEFQNISCYCLSIMH